MFQCNIFLNEYSATFNIKSKISLPKPKGILLQRGAKLMPPMKCKWCGPVFLDKHLNPGLNEILQGGRFNFKWMLSVKTAWIICTILMKAIKTTPNSFQTFQMMGFVSVLMSSLRPQLRLCMYSNKDQHRWRKWILFNLVQDSRVKSYKKKLFFWNWVLNQTLTIKTWFNLLPLAIISKGVKFVNKIRKTCSLRVTSALMFQTVVIYKSDEILIIQEVNSLIIFLKCSFWRPTRGRAEQSWGSQSEAGRPSLSAFCFNQFVSLKFPSSAVPAVDTMQSALPHIR